MKLKTEYILVRTVPLVITLVALMLLTSACGSKSSSGRKRAVNPVPIGGGFGSPGIGCGSQNGNLSGTALLLRTRSTYQSYSQQGGLEMELDLLGQAGGNYPYNDPKIAIYYNGPLQATGRLVINGTHRRLCNAPPGQYVVSSQVGQPGVWNSTVAQELRLTSCSGPANLKLIIKQGVPYNPNTISKDDPNNRLYGRVIVESVGGQPCNDYVDVY